VLASLVALFIVIGIVLFLLAVAGLAVEIWAIVDVAQRPESDYVGVSLDRTSWLILLVVLCVLAGPVGLGVAIYYLAAIRPRLNSHR